MSVCQAHFFQKTRGAIQVEIYTINIPYSGVKPLGADKFNFLQRDYVNRKDDRVLPVDL